MSSLIHMYICVHIYAYRILEKSIKVFREEGDGMDRLFTLSETQPSYLWIREYNCTY